MNRRQLAQVRPSGTTAVSLFTLATATPYLIDMINVCNVSAADVDVSLFHDIDGSTYDETTALLWNYTLVPGAVLHFSAYVADYQSTGNVGCKVSVADAATFTAYGEVYGELR